MASGGEAEENQCFRERGLVAFPKGDYREKTAVLEPESRRGHSPDAKPVSALILDFPASRIVRNTWLLHKPPTIWHFFYSILNALKLSHCSNQSLLT